MNQFPPKPLSITFRKFPKIFASQDPPPVSLTSVANGKNLQPEKFEIFFGHIENFFFTFSIRCNNLILFPLFATGVVDTGGAP